MSEITKRLWADYEVSVSKIPSIDPGLNPVSVGGYGGNVRVDSTCLGYPRFAVQVDGTARGGERGAPSTVDRVAPPVGGPG